MKDPKDTAIKVMREIFPDATDEQYSEAAEFVVMVAEVTAKTIVTLVGR